MLPQPTPVVNPVVSKLVYFCELDSQKLNQFTHLLS